MRNFFTKHLFLMILSFAAIDMMGQVINTLTVNAPSGIAGDYAIIRAGFGSTSNAPITANTTFVNDGSTEGTGGSIYDGCQAPTNTITGTIAFIDRGSCPFVQKVTNAQTAGATAVIICNNVAAWPFVIGVQTAPDVTIPVFSMSQADCAKLRVDIISGGVNVTFKNKCTVTYPADAFWGKEVGQGDFNGGLNDWTVEYDDPALEGRDVWTYRETGFPAGTVSFSTNDIKSATQCNGIIAMDFFSLQREDNPQLVQPYFRYNASLVSPPIDCRGKNFVSIQFTMLHNRLNGNTQISFFDGTEWSAPVNIATQNAVNTSAVSETVTYALPQFANKEGCKVKFTGNSDFYYFALDDVMFLNKESVDIRVNKNWFAGPPTLKVPKSQVAEMPFMADVENVGNSPAVNTVLSVKIKDPNGNVIEELENVYGDVEAISIVENVNFPVTYTPPGVPGKYTGTYEISSDTEDGDKKANNIADFEFHITDNTYSMLLSEEEVGAPYFEDLRDNWVVDISNYYSTGNVYYVVKGGKFTIDQVRFGLGNTEEELAGPIGAVTVDVYELNELAGVSNGALRTLVGTGSILLENLDNLRNIPVEIFAVDDEGGPSDNKMELKDNTNYFVTLGASPFDASFPRMQFLQYSGRDNNSYDRSIYFPPANLALENAEINRVLGGYWAEEGTEEDLRTRGYSFLGNTGFGSFATAYIEVDIKDLSSTYDIAKTGTATVFPNPASRELYIDLTLDNVSANVRVDLVTIEGKVATSKSFSNIQDTRLKLDLGGLVSGTYTAMIHTDNGVISKKVIVQK